MRKVYKKEQIWLRLIVNICDISLSYCHRAERNISTGRRNAHVVSVDQLCEFVDCASESVVQQERERVVSSCPKILQQKISVRVPSVTHSCFDLLSIPNRSTISLPCHED